MSIEELKAKILKMKALAVGVWTDECGICHERKPCTNLHHDWNPPKEGATDGK